MSVIVGEKLTFGQADGTEIRLYVYGDEHYARYEKEDGYTVVYDTAKGIFCYADIASGQLVSTGISALVGPPAGLRQHLRESAEVRRRKTPPHHDRHGSSPRAAELRNFTFGPSAGLLSGRRLSIGTVRGLTILVNFQDVTTQVTRQNVDDLLNGQNYTANGNLCSAREYFLRVSDGKLDYTNTVVGPFTLSQPRQYYVTHLLVEEALNLALASGVNLADFDSLNQGIVDALNVMYAGQTQYLGDLWPHNHSINLQRGNLRTDLYLLTSMGRTASELSIGTFCHENGHLLCRFPDMYDYGDRDDDTVDSEGIGAYCLMGSGNHNGFGKTPSPVCAYLRDLAGWCDDVVSLNQGRDVEVPHGNYRQLVKYETGKPNEYFLVENRSKMGLDVGLPGSGLAVYHCDTLGSNEYQDGTASRHYQCALLQADGRRDLERNLNRGDGTDLFASITGTVITAQTNPSSRLWDGSASGLEIGKISAPGAQMTFTVGSIAEPAAVIRFAAQPGAAIADNSPEWTESKIQVDPTGNLTKVVVSLDISHSWIGDLIVELRSPSGKTAVLHNTTGGNHHNLVQTYSSESLTALAALVGEAINGAWTLRVRDTAAEDVGVLNRWSLELTVERPPEVLTKTVTANLAIPDYTTAGIQSVCALAGAGVAQRVKVTVDISHTWIGDLRIQLVSPTGRSVTLHAQVGGSQKDLKASYDSAVPNSPLASMVGQSIAGNWVLRVADLAARDKGTLNTWTLEVTRAV
jgi:M6 family metalloprotease-like protein